VVDFYIKVLSHVYTLNPYIDLELCLLKVTVLSKIMRSIIIYMIYQILLGSLTQGE